MTDGDPVTSAVVEPSEPVKKTPNISGQQKIAMQALDDALAHHGEKSTATCSRTTAGASLSTAGASSAIGTR